MKLFVIGANGRTGTEILDLARTRVTKSPRSFDRLRNSASPSTADDLEVFESHRPLLVAHAYRMLGDLGARKTWCRRRGCAGAAATSK
jgi:hypothetical protein